ncbi:hypothetical protein EDB85DRAFT_1897990 [Lactarius pseudohatsudake]|nr:hypothetical protein EDB85DRAFT_1897990 [Lactarius pseudohatsudake]
MAAEKKALRIHANAAKEYLTPEIEAWAASKDYGGGELRLPSQRTQSIRRSWTKIYMSVVTELQTRMDENKDIRAAIQPDPKETKTTGRRLSQTRSVEVNMPCENTRCRDNVIGDAGSVKEQKYTTGVSAVKVGQRPYVVVAPDRPREGESNGEHAAMGAKAERQSDTRH